MPNKGWLYLSMLRGRIRAGNTKQSSSAREVHEEYVHMVKKENVKWGERRLRTNL